MFSMAALLIPYIPKGRRGELSLMGSWSAGPPYTHEVEHKST